MTSAIENVRTVLVCHGTGCISARSPDILSAIEAEAEGSGTQVKLTGCHGFCQQGPIVIVEPEGVFYAQVATRDVPKIVDSHLRNSVPYERLFYKDPATGDPIANYRDIPFYRGQQRQVLRNTGRINSEDIEEYIAVGGYAALRKALTQMTPDEVIQSISDSGLRGRGGAGFPVGRKWDFCRAAPGEDKQIVCNADEGDPGAFMDRSLLEADPHAILEGMIIAAYAIGATAGHIYVRAEYPLAVKRLEIAIEQATRKGLLGDNILGGNFSFSLRLFQGAGAFVCGEETALLTSIEGNRGIPRNRPPFPAQSGLWGKPTLINNVKTYAYVPLIIDRGADWFSSTGTETSKGTAIFALTGNVANSGLIEVPMGTTLREIVYDIGGGIPGGKQLKAVQTGGPSGGCLPASLLDSPIDYESLKAAGSIMGSGGMVVMDEDTCMVDVARYFLDFTQKESCGNCVPCRLGTKQMLNILEDITQGKGRPEDIDLLLDLGAGVTSGSLCGLGQTAPNPVLTTIRYFRDEYEAHIFDRACPAGNCRELISYRISPDLCVGCPVCKKVCPGDAISGEHKGVHVIDQSACTQCGMCYEVCPPKVHAVELISKRILDGGSV